jgi:ABC-2 type transport system permease protein
MNGVAMYFHYVAASVKSQWQYKLNFVLVTVGVFVMNGLDALGLWALFGRFGAIPGWTLPHALLLYGVVNTVFAVSDAFWRGFDIFNRFIRDGQLDRMLLRPRSLFVQLLGYEFRINRAGRLAQGLLVLVLAVVWSDITWTACKVLMLLWSMLNGLMLFGGMFIIQAAICFFSVESIEVVNAVSYGGVYVAAYPMEIYGTWFRRFFTYAVPLAAVAYYPVCFILDKGAISARAAFLIPLAGTAFCALAALVFYKVGMPNYRSTGT